MAFEIIHADKAAIHLTSMRNVLNLCEAVFERLQAAEAEELSAARESARSHCGFQSAFDKEKRRAVALSSVAAAELKAALDIAKADVADERAVQLRELICLVTFGERLKKLRARGVLAQYMRGADISELIDAADAEETHARIVALSLEVKQSEECAMRQMYQSFARQHVTPHAARWRFDEGMPSALVIDPLVELGALGLNIQTKPQARSASIGEICIALEELSRADLAVGSLVARFAGAAELLSGDKDAYAQWAPALARGEAAPICVEFHDGDAGHSWRKAASRIDVMSYFASSTPQNVREGWLSLLLAPRAPKGKERESAEEMGYFCEIMGFDCAREFEISLPAPAQPGLSVPRIFAAARAVGVAQVALDISLEHARKRIQFRDALINSPRVYRMLSKMIVSSNLARELTSAAANKREAGASARIEAAIAKLMSIRAAGEAAESGMQICNASPQAWEHPICRVLCDARQLSTFEGAHERQLELINTLLLQDA